MWKRLPMQQKVLDVYKRQGRYRYSDEDGRGAADGVELVAHAGAYHREDRDEMCIRDSMALRMAAMIFCSLNPTMRPSRFTTVWILLVLLLRLLDVYKRQVTESLITYLTLRIVPTLTGMLGSRWFIL